jgi:hypothetical protein
MPSSTCSEAAGSCVVRLQARDAEPDQQRREDERENEEPGEDCDVNHFSLSFGNPSILIDGLGDR